MAFTETQMKVAALNEAEMLICSVLDKLNYVAGGFSPEEEPRPQLDNIEDQLLKLRKRVLDIIERY